jgi:hypothetical protein
MQIPEGLIDQFESHDVLLLIGEGVDRGYLPQSAELAEQLAAECQYPQGEPRTLARVAEHYIDEYPKNLHALIVFLQKRLSAPQREAPRLYDLLARLPVRTIVTTCYHHQFEHFLAAKDIRYTPVIRESQISSISAGQLTLVWLWGALEDPETLRITEDERRQFFTTQETFARAIRERVATQSWLCIGADADDERLRDFYERAVLKPDRLSRPPYFVGKVPTDRARRLWEKNSYAIFFGEDTERFVEALLDRLDARSAARTRTPNVKHDPLVPYPSPDHPYIELAAFDKRSRDRFFGREEDIERIVRRIESNRLFVLYGASGVGKTSLLQAGVTPRLEHTDPPYTVIFVRAFRDPHQAIRDEVLKALAPQGVTLPEHQALSAFLAAAAQVCPGWLLIVFDQFEEFFINVEQKSRDDFIADLQAINNDQALRIKMLFSLREDWLPHMDEIEDRIPRLAKLRLKPLTRAQARAAIVGPVERLNIVYAPELIEALLTDLSERQSEHSEVMPPQLQIVCARLFDARDAREMRLTLTLYEQLGKAERILNDYLDEALKSFSPSRQQLAYRVLEELVTAYGTKAVKDLAELAHDTEAAPETLQPVVNGMLERRLLRPVEIAPGRFGYELAHEYLIRRHDLDDPSTRRRREQEKLLKQEVETWRHYGYLLGSSRLVVLFDLRAELHLSPRMQELLLRSALETGHRIEEWAACVENPERRIAILIEVASGNPPATPEQPALPYEEEAPYEPSDGARQHTG